MTAILVRLAVLGVIDLAYMCLFHGMGWDGVRMVYGWCKGWGSGVKSSSLDLYLVHVGGYIRVWRICFLFFVFSFGGEVVFCLLGLMWDDRKMGEGGDESMRAVFVC